MSSNTEANMDSTDTNLSLTASGTESETETETDTPTATATELLALTTPFKQPSGCDSHFARTSVLSTLGRSTSTVPILLSTAEPSCYPSGWEDIVPESRFHFRPAVCPSDWIYYTIAEDAEVSGSTAYCCNTGYTFINYDDYELIAAETFSSAHCARWVGNTDDRVATGDTTAASNINADLTLMLHNAWAITWNTSDTSTLTPQLPTLTNGMEVPSWTPGEEIPDGKYDASPQDDGPISDGMRRFLTIGLPIIGVAFVVLIAYLCVWCRRRRNKPKTRLGQLR